MRYVINGRFLSQKITGVQRMAREIVKAMDGLVNKDDFCLAVPKDYDNSYELNNIKIIVVGNLIGNKWEQISYFLFIKKNNLIGINLGNVAPILKPDIVCIHDMKLVRNPSWFDWKYVLWSKLNYYNALMRGKLILTVSEFSKSEIEELYPRKKAKILVIDEGWQHMSGIECDERVLCDNDLVPQGYYFSLYQSIPNKNFRWIINAAKVNKNDIFVVSGWNNAKLNKDDVTDIDIEKIPNIKVLGYLSDEEMKSLVKNCKAFIYPSLYEGFGIPPLEALSVGAKVLVMDIPVMRELFSDSVQYLKEDTYRIEIDDAIEGDLALRLHSWKHGAELILETIQSVS